METYVIKWKHIPCYWSFVRGIHRSPVNSPHKGQWRGALIFFFHLRLIKRLNKQSRGWWFKTPSRPLWRHCNEIDNDDFCNWLAEPFRQQTLELLLCRIVYIYIYICIYMYVYIYKVNIWNVNCAQASAFIFDSRTDVLRKVPKFWRQKMSRHQRDSSSQTANSCRIP